MTQTVISQKEVQDLIFGKYSSGQILEAVNDQEWQKLRKKLKGLGTKDKIKELRRYRQERGDSEKIKIQITNYVNALKRGGLIK